MTTPAFDAKAFLRSVSSSPGVYQMLSVTGEILYVGKAKHLKHRLGSYFQKQLTDAKTRSLVKHIHAIEVIVTASDTEALLLENTLIKKYKPKYNILFRDDKSYPYLFLTAHTFPRMQLIRGKQSLPGDYFGPLASAQVARQSLQLLQKVFKLRNCQNSYFNNRTRPCLQYQIGRCTAPCVNYVTAENYQQQVEYVKQFLAGKDQSIIDELVKKMQQASESMAFETAAQLRDQITLLRQAQEQQYMLTTRGEVDAIGFAMQHGVAVLSLVQIRQGQVLAHKTYIPERHEGSDPVDLITAFLSQHYLVGELSHLPKTIIIPEELPEQAWLAENLSVLAKHKVHIVAKPKQDQRQWQLLALRNAEQALTQRLQDKLTVLDRLAMLSKDLGLNFTPQRIECFDISHFQGEATMASCVVMTQEGMAPQQYRRFSLKTVTNDDYGAMHEVLTRRYQRLVKEEAVLPDLILIDGGKGQLAVAQAVLAELALKIPLLAIAKGVTRKPGFEILWSDWRDSEFTLAADSMALHVLQQIRDEAHRFAITGQRQRLRKTRTSSVLESIPGIGPTRRRALLIRFGSLANLSKASVDELAKVPGFSKRLAQTLFDTLHA